MTSMPRNPHIQGLRGIAASLVVIDHTLDVISKHGLLPQWLGQGAHYSIGGLGVYIFFVISGFIMVNISYDDFGRLSKSLSFAKRRIIRVVPTYWIATFVAFALYVMLPLSQHPSFLHLVQSLTFIPYSTDGALDMQPVLGQGWTLNYEMYFYMLFALALLSPRRIGLPALFIVFGLIVAGGSYLKPLADPAPASTVLSFFADPIILLFALGMAIGVLRQNFKAFYVKNPFQIAVALIVLQVALLMLFTVPPRIGFPMCIWTWIFGSIAVAACAFAAPKIRDNWFEKLSEVVGDASYSMYLFHVFFVFALAKLFPITVITAVPYMIIALLGSMLFGIVFFNLVERPTALFFRTFSLISWRVATLQGRA
jgi:exopolysaccharide production protein ExoZ